MPKVTQEHLDRRRMEVLEAARRCFSRNGFHDTTMQDICRESNLSAGAIYRYFRSKQEIIVAIGEAAQRGRDQAIGTIAASQDPQRALKTLLRAYFAGLQTDEAKAGVRLDLDLWSAGLRDPQIRAALREGRGAALDILSQILERGREQGLFHSGWDGDGVAALLGAVMNGAELQAALTPDVELEPMLRPLLAFVDLLRREPPEDPK